MRHMHLMGFATFFTFDVTSKGGGDYNLPQYAALDITFKRVSTSLDIKRLVIMRWLFGSRLSNMSFYSSP